MKKILTAIVALMLMLAVAACAYADGVTGDWYGEMYGMVMKLTINEDNTYAMEMAGEVMPGVWEMDGTNLIMDKGTGNEGVFAYDAEAQTLNMMDEMILTRDVIEQWVPAAARAEAAIEDFAGVWTANYVDAFGAVLPVDAAGAYMDAAIEGANVSVTVTFMEPETFAGEAVLEAGALTLTVPAKDEFSTESVFTANALEDGTISIGMELFSSPAVFYLEKAE